MPKPTHKPRKIPPECPKCGEVCTVIWMRDGRVLRAGQEKKRVIFCNYANASGHYQNVYIEHDCDEGK